jgi:putative chitinase
MFTKDTLFKIFPNAPKSKLDLDAVADKINHVFHDAGHPAGMYTLERRASFLAQLGHESAEFTAIKENLNYSSAALQKVFKKYFPTKELADAFARKPEKIANRVYADRMGNGNEASGDGYKFCGRGFLQLTGKSNYVKCGLSLGIDLVANPDYLATPDGAVDSALWFWKVNSLNTYADHDDIKGQTKIINGGYNGLDERIALYEKAKIVLTT